VQTVGGLSNVRTWNLALGAEDGTATLHVSSGPYGSAASSLLAPREHLSELPAVGFETDLVVPQLTLSTWAQEHGIPRCDLLALDLQGMELSVLEASRGLLPEVSVVIAEVFTNEKYAGCGTVGEMQAFLTGEGFVVLETNMYWGTCGDMLAVNRAALERATS
jgi:FkbM family methyltransferase